MIARTNQISRFEEWNQGFNIALIHAIAVGNDVKMVEVIQYSGTRLVNGGNNLYVGLL